MKLFKKLENVLLTDNYSLKHIQRVRKERIHKYYNNVNYKNNENKYIRISSFALYT